MRQIPRLMVAAPASGSGKSVITSGIMAALSGRFQVQGFKVGPDYIDPMYHTAATGRPSHNLDTWMLSPETVQRIFASASEGASISLIEGAMGFFDGYGSDPFVGSSASVASLLKTPVILVVDCSKISGSAAAMVHGFHTFCNSLSLAGVICNRVGSQHHCQWLTEAIEMRNNIPVLGCVPRLPALQIPERHLGLFTVAERQDAAAKFIQQAGRLLATYINLDRLLEIAGTAITLPEIPDPEPLPSSCIRLAVARDEAFCFYYEENLEELRRCGAEIIPFSPLNDKHLPEGIDGIYFGGGYPELYARRLSENIGMRNQVLQRCRENMPVYAECGGLMYLTEGIHLQEGDFPLAGVVPGWCFMGDRLKMGYRMVKTLNAGIIGAAGQGLRGHEFHYSQWENPYPEYSAFCISPRSDHDRSRLDGFIRGNLHATYIHLHFGQNACLASNLVEACRIWQKN